MRAALVSGQGTIELREFPDPVPAPGGVVVDIIGCGICGTDVHAFQSGHPYPPAVCGHEWAGHVSAVGAEVGTVGEGDRVVVAVPPACGACAACRAGHTAHCQRVLAMAGGGDPLAPRHGGFAPRIAVGAGRVLPADPALSDDEAVQVEPTTVALHAVRASGLRPDDVAVVQGAGPIGLTTLQVVRASDAGEVIVIEPDERRRALALELGAHVAVAPGTEANELIAERTGGLGADIVFECVGRGFAIQAAVDLARRGGSMCLIGVADGAASINPLTWIIKEIHTTSAFAYVHDEFEMAMAMMADGRIRVAPLHTTTVGLDQLADTMAELADGSSTHVKVVVDPTL